jgi:signal transduction histidine kinase/DNA-binding response OmpR family regulator
VNDKSAVQTPAPTREQYQALEMELKRLQREHKKISRQYVFLQKLMLRTKDATASNMNLSIVLQSEKSSREVFLELILQNSPNIILVFDGSNRLLYGTAFFLKLIDVPHMGLLTGRTPTEIFAGLLSEDDMRALDDCFALAVKTKTPAMHTQIIQFSSHERPRNMVIQITPLIDPDINIAGTLMLFHDQTEEIEARQAEASSEAKTAFMASMSHEIRTPLNTIMALSKAELQRSLPEHTRVNLSKINSAGGTLLSIINDLLDISKAESGHFQIQPVPYDLANLISDAISINIVRIGTKPIEFRLTIGEKIPSMFFGDELRVKQILNNLLSNAFKYTESGHVTLECFFTLEGEDSRLHFTVSDTGRGIKPEFLNEIFAPYTQADLQTNKNIEGTGLGLTICRELVQLMNGEISVESVYGQGSVFKVSIEQQVHDPAPIGAEVVESLKNFQFLSRSTIEQHIINRFYLPRGRVLVVDDVETNLDVAMALLQPYGLTVDCVSSGAQAIALLQSAPHQYDCIFMDHMMPEMDGIETVRHIREDIGSDYAQSVPIVAMTANALVGSEQLFLKSGFQAFISKPIDLNKLDLILNKLVKDRYPDADTETRPPDDDFEGPDAYDDAERRKKVSDEIRKRLSTYYIDGIDLVKGLARYEGKESVYVPLLRSFVRHAPLMLNDLRNPNSETLPNYAIRVHGLKGAGAGICADKLAAGALELEMAAKKPDLELVLSKNDDFISDCETLIREISIMIRDFPVDKDDDKKTVRLRPDPGDLSGLMKACQTFKNNDIQRHLKNLESYTYEADGELVSWLRDQADNIEYELIYERLSEYLAAFEGAERLESAS